MTSRRQILERAVAAIVGVSVAPEVVKAQCRPHPWPPVLAAIDFNQGARWLNAVVARTRRGNPFVALIHPSTQPKAER